MKFGRLLPVIIGLTSANFVVHGISSDAFQGAGGRSNAKDADCCTLSEPSKADEFFPAGVTQLQGSSVQNPKHLARMRPLFDPPAYNCFMDCEYLGPSTQFWCQNAPDCDDGFPWHDNYEKERTKYTFDCGLDGIYVKCNAWGPSGCCGSHDASAPLCISGGQHYCNGSEL